MVLQSRIYVYEATCVHACAASRAAAMMMHATALPYITRGPNAIWQIGTSQFNAAVHRSCAAPARIMIFFQAPGNGVDGWTMQLPGWSGQSTVA